MLRRAALVMMLVGSAAVSAAAGPFENMATHIPSDANAIVMFNVSKIHASPMAKKGGWVNSHASAFADGMVFLPPTADRFVMAANMDFSMMRPKWQVSLMDFSKVAMDLSEIAKKFGGTTDKINDLPAVYLPSNRFIVQLGTTRLGSMTPGERQAVGRWTQHFNAPRRLSPYIQQALSYADQVGTEIVIALDAENVLSPAEIAEEVKNGETFKGQDVDVQLIAGTIASMRGVTLGITFNAQQPYGKLKVEFKESADPLAPYAKDLILNVLKEQGAMIDDFENWTGKAEPNLISIEGYFGTEGLRQILSVFETPGVMHANEGTAMAPGDKQQQLAYSSQQYFSSVRGLISDLEKKKPQRLSQYGVWYENYARKIDNLPMLNVDPDMLDYGRYIAQVMRSASGVVKNSGMRTRAREVNAVNQGGYGVPYYYGAGGYGVNRGGNAWGGGWGVAGRQVPSFNAYLGEQQSRRTQVRVQEKTAAASQVTSLMGEVQEATAQIRRTMTERYQIEF